MPSGDLACRISTHVLLQTKTKALEGRYRRVVSLTRGSATLYFVDLMAGNNGDDRTPEGLYKWAVDNQEYRDLSNIPVPHRENAR